MLGESHSAQDATQEILVKVVTSLGQFRGESQLRTWIWRIATRHLLRVRTSAWERRASFEGIEALVAEGETQREPFEREDAWQLAEEVRVGCTQAMLLALERKQRMAFILGDVFELPAEQAAEVLEIQSAAYRKRLERARAELGGFLARRCGLANPLNACRCLRQIPVAARHGLITLEEVRHKPALRTPEPERFAQAYRDMREIEHFARVFHEAEPQPAPEHILAQIKDLLHGGKLRLFDA